MQKVFFPLSGKEFLGLLILAFLGSFYAYQLSWICDDAFISFQYARNFAEGKGLVFQSGERVEGYSNFLWTIFLSLSFPLKISPESLSIYSGIFFYFCTILLFRNLPEAILYLAFYHGTVFATGGLETSSYTFMIFLLFRLWESGQKWNAIVFSALLPLVRPEGAIWTLGLLGLIFYETVFSRRSISKFWIRITKRNSKFYHFLGTSPRKIPFQILFIFLCFGIWIGKILYYGDIFPNTYYAKVDGGEYFRQGLVYFFLFFKEYKAFSIILLICIIFHRSKFSWLVLLYLGYVLYVGGDFMFGRFLVPIIPVGICMVWDRFQSAKKVWEERSPMMAKYLYPLTFGLLLISPIVRGKIYANNPEKIWKETGVSEERILYKDLGKGKFLYNTEMLKDCNVAFFGSQAHFIYYMKPKLGIESSTGLTDPFISRIKLENRGMIGHEKKAPLDYLRERNVHLLMMDVYPELNENERIIYNWNQNPLTWVILKKDPCMDGWAEIPEILWVKKSKEIPKDRF
jgi:hypothetical protein